MAAKNLLEIVIQAVNKDVDKVTKQVKDQFKSMGDVVNSSMNQAFKSSEQLTKSLDTISKNLGVSRRQLQSIGVDGTSSFAKLNNAQKKALLNITESSNRTKRLISDFGNLSNSTLKWKDHMDLARLQIQATGGSVDTLKGKFQTVGIALESSFISKIEPIKNKFSTLISPIENIAGKIKNSLSGAFNTVATKVTSIATSIKTKLSNALSAVGNGIKSLGDKFSGLGGIISSAVGALGMASMSQLTIGLAMTREQMTNLTTATMGSTNAAKSFVNTMDKMTNNSLVSLNDLGQAMSTIKISTGVTNSELEKLLPTVNDIGQRAILMGKNSDEAMNMMTAAGKGLNGEFDILKSNFGVTKEALKDLGWKGTTDDVEGYIKALDKYMEKTGNMDSMMNTTTGKIAQVKKGFTAAGRQIGEVFMPYINQALDGMLNLKDTCPDIYKGIILVGAGISGLATVLPMISPAIDTFNNLTNGISNAKKVISGIGDTVSTAKSAIDGLKTAQEGASFATNFLALSSVGLSAEESALAAANAGLTLEQYNSLVASNLQAAGYDVVAASAEGAAVAETSALLPLLAIVAVAALVAAAIYEIGKSFGWWTDVSSMIEAIHAGINRLWSAFINNPDVQGIIQGLSDAFNWLMEVLTPVGQWFMDSLGVTQPAGEEFDIVRAIIDTLGSSFHTIVEVLTSFYNALLFVAGCIQNTISFFQWLYNCIVNIPTAAANMVTGIITWFSQLPGLVWNWIVNTASRILTGMLVWVNYGKAKAQVFINAIIGFIKTLPGRVYTYIVSTASRILSGAASWVSNARNKASAMVSAVTGAISGLPGAVYQEFLNIGNRIVQAGQSVLNRAKEFGANLKNAVLNALGIHSPGIIQEKIATEFANIPGRIVETGKSVYDSAAEYGSKILEGFRTNDMSELDVSPSMNIESSDIPSPTSVGAAVIGTEIDTTGVETGMVTTENIVSSGFNNMLLSEQNSMFSMVSDVNNNVGLIQLKEQTSMDTMTKHVDTSMFNILNTTKSGLKSVTSTTKTNLSNMQSSTTKVTKNMVSAWGSMKDSILTVANKIQSGAYTKFKSLHTTIKSFYDQIQSASFGSLAAGPGPSNGTSRSGPIFRMPIAKSTVKSGSGVNFQKRVADTIAQVYAVTGLQATPVGPNGEELYAAFNVDRTANTHINKIMNTAYKWPLKNPKFLGATIPLNYKVGDLKNGKSGKDVLRGLDFETVMNAIWAAHGGWGYSYYFNSRMSPAQAFHGHSFNCYDGAQMVVAIANMMSKSAHMVHGSWNGIGHMGAIVDGKLFDTTQRSNRGVWRGSSGVHFGPAPSDPFKNLENAISNLATDNSTGETFDVYTGKTVESSELKLSGEFTINHTVEGLPDTVDEETVVRLLSEATQDENFVKSLVNNMKFQLADLKMKQRIEDKNNRAKGV